MDKSKKRINKTNLHVAIVRLSEVEVPQSKDVNKKHNVSHCEERGIALVCRQSINTKRSYTVCHFEERIIIIEM